MKDHVTLKTENSSLFVYIILNCINNIHNSTVLLYFWPNKCSLAYKTF